MPYPSSRRSHREDKAQIDERTRQALRKVGKVGSAVSWGYMSPSDTESEFDEEMHEAMSRLGKKGAAIRWGRQPPEQPGSRSEHFARKRPLFPPEEDTEEETEEEEERERGYKKRPEIETKRRRFKEEEEPSEGGYYQPSRSRQGYHELSEETRRKLHRAGLRGASARWHHDYERDEMRRRGLGSRSQKENY